MLFLSGKKWPGKTVTVVLWLQNNFDTFYNISKRSNTTWGIATSSECIDQRKTYHKVSMQGYKHISIMFKTMLIVLVCIADYVHKLLQVQIFWSISEESGLTEKGHQFCNNILREGKWEVGKCAHIYPWTLH